MIPRPDLASNAGRMYLLEFTEGPRTGQKLILRRKSVRLGSAADADVRLEGDGVLPEHAEITLRHPRATVSGPQGGDAVLAVNERPVRETDLRDDDAIRIGPHALRYRAIQPPMPLLRRPATWLQRSTTVAVSGLLAFQLAFLIVVSLLWRSQGVPLVLPEKPKVQAQPRPAPKVETARNEKTARPAAVPAEMPDKPAVAQAKPAPLPAPTPPTTAPPVPLPTPAVAQTDPKPAPTPPAPLPAPEVVQKTPSPTPLPAATQSRPEAPPTPPAAAPAIVQADPKPAPMPAPAPAPAPAAAANPLEEARAAFASGDLIGAERLVAKALQANAADPEALAIHARVLDQQGRFKEAVAAWSSVLEAKGAPATLRTAAQAEHDRLLGTVRLLDQSQAMAARVRQDERASPLQAAPETNPPPAAPAVAAAPAPSPRLPPARSIVLQSAQIERLVGGPDIEDMRMLTITLLVDRNAPPLRGEDVRIKTVFYDQDRQSRRVEVSAVRVPEGNATLTGNLRADQTISVTRPYVVPAGFRRAQTGSRPLSFHGFVVEIYHQDRLVQQYARPSSLLSN